MGEKENCGKKNISGKGASLWTRQGAPSQSMTLALARLHLPCQPQSEPRHHSSIRPTPCLMRFDAEHEGGREKKKKEKKKRKREKDDMMSSNAIPPIPRPTAGFCDDTSSRPEKRR